MARGRPRGPGATRGQDGETPTSPIVTDETDGVVPPFFNTTFSTHRVSPLYVGSGGLTSNRLSTLAHRLRDSLAGDVVRGIQIGLEATDTPTGQVGPLKAVQIRWFNLSSIFGEDQGAEVFEESNDGTGETEKQKRGLWIEIRHENAAYVGMLLPSSSNSPLSNTAKPQDWTMQPDVISRSTEQNSNHFCHLPLLLLRMPLPLKNVISEWLSTTFDCRVSKMVLGTKTIVNVWESWANVAGLPRKGPDFVVTLAFNAPLPEDDGAMDVDSDTEATPDNSDPGLRSVEITISPEDLRRFVRAGKALPHPKDRNANTWKHDPRERRRLAGGNADDGWGWRDNQDPTTFPFTEALASYLDHHLALNLFHPSVRITQISCAGFVLGQSRLKIIKLGEMSSELHQAAWTFVSRLGEHVEGSELPRLFSAE